jgi:hypothetical protein
MVGDFPKWEDLGTAILERTKSLQGMPSADEQWLQRFLKIAWNTEFLLSVGADDAELLRINNQWTPIQCYYAVYAGAEAAGYALDGSHPDGHQKALNKCSEYFRKSGLSPWNKFVVGARGRDGTTTKLTNFPANTRIPHNLERAQVQPVEMIARCLTSEHSHRIDDFWKPGCGIRKYAFEPSATGLLHFLYRLRVKSNYHEVDIFVSEAPEKNVKEFAQALGFICFRTLLYFEIIVLRKCKKKRLLEIGADYLKMNPKANRIEKRLAFYQTAL